MMKKIYATLLLTQCAILGTVAQPLATDNFDFTGDLSSNGWVSANSLGVNNIKTTAGLSYDGYTGSGVGNAAAIGTSGQDVYKFLATPQVASGTPIYLSAMVSVTETADKAGDYFFHLSNTSGSNLTIPYPSRLYARTVGNVVNFGTTVAGTVVWGSTEFAKNTTYLAIIKFVNNPAGADEAKLWVLAAGVPATEIEAGTPLATETGDFTGLNISAVVLRQGLVANAPAVTIDGVRVSNTWDLVEGALPVSLTSFTASKSGNANLITWGAASLQQLARFELQKSTDGNSFITVNTQAPQLSITAVYTYNDLSIASQPIVYYRLKILAVNGSVTYSKMLKLEGSLQAGFGVWPNPVAGTLNLKYPTITKQATVTIITMDGKVLKVYNLPRQTYQTSLNATGLPQGNYRLVFEEGNTKLSTLMMKQ
jgi:hypothetical protein